MEPLGVESLGAVSTNRTHAAYLVRRWDGHAQGCLGQRLAWRELSGLAKSFPDGPAREAAPVAAEALKSTCAPGR